MRLYLPSCQMVFVCGPVSSGKTHLIKQWIENDNRHVIFDGTGEFLDDKREQIWSNPRALWERLKKNPYFYRIVYQPGKNRSFDFGHVLNALWWIDTPKTLICDEFHEICPVEATSEEVEMMLRFARHNRLGFVGASQRIADVHKLYTSGCRMSVLFWTQEARDLEAIEDRWRCAEMVENLRPLLHDDISGTTRQIPQAVVCVKGQKPFVFDFASDSAVMSSAQAESEVNEGEEAIPSPSPQGEEEQEDDSSETPEGV